MSQRRRDSRLDARLAVPALATWFAAAVALRYEFRWSALVAVLAGLVAAGVVGGVRGRRSVATPADHSRVPAVWLLIGAACAGTALGAGATAPRVALRDTNPVAVVAADRGSATVDFTLSDDPRAVTGGAVPQPTFVVRAKANRLLSASPGASPLRIHGDVRLVVFGRGSAWGPLLPGQRVRAVGKLSPGESGHLTAATLTTGSTPVVLGRPPWQQRAAGSLRVGLREAAGVVPQPARGLIPALSVGDTSLLTDELVAQFRATGMLHLTAVSGANLALVIGAVLLAARWVRIGPRGSAVLAAVALLGFVVLARPSPSVLRAAVMAAIGLVALFSGRGRSAFPALMVAIMLLVALDPELATSPGFVLSVLATAGLVIFAVPWREALIRRGLPRGIADALAVPAAAGLACAPAIAALAGTVGLVSIPANLLASVAVAPITILGICAAVVSPLWLVGKVVASWLAFAAGLPARWLVWVADWGSGLRYGQLPWPSGLVGAALLVLTIGLCVLAWRYRPLRWSCLALVLGLLCVLLPLDVLDRDWPPRGWIMTACDVGQGDATVLRVGEHGAVVIDAGQEPASVDRCLTGLNIDHVPLFILSHPHADHLGGLAGVSRGRQVSTAWTGPARKPDSGHRRLTEWAERNRVRLVGVEAGTVLTLGALTLTVLGPRHVFSGTRSDPNNNSLIVAARVDGVDILLPGDAENAAQEAALAEGGIEQVDVLKVPHHGSAYSEPEFLDAARPRVAVVSVGRNNRYGHPSQAIVRHLRHNGARLVRTDTDGDIAVVSAAGGVRVARHLRQR